MEGALLCHEDLLGAFLLIVTVSLSLLQNG
ncbi:hypothetical protein CWRG_01903 [Chthonomonas calidirosea]|nr:hypothetical protein CWRG_01903 [Chthonomonas calidirosea]